MENQETNVQEQVQEHEPEMLTISKDEFNKAIQSETDKVRTKYVQQVKELEDKLSKLQPEQLTPEQERIAELEAELSANKQHAALTNKGVSAELLPFLKDGIDADELVNVLENVVNSRLAANGFVPQGHAANEGINAEQFKAMSYQSKAELYAKNPTAYKMLSQKFK